MGFLMVPTSIEAKEEHEQYLALKDALDVIWRAKSSTSRNLTFLPLPSLTIRKLCYEDKDSDEPLDEPPRTRTTDKG